MNFPKLAKSMKSSSQQEKIQVTTPTTEVWNPFIGGYGFNMNQEIDDMIKTTNRLQVWEWFRDEEPPENAGYCYWGHENVNAISNGLENNNHSGASFGICMRQIQFIAKNSWEAWNERNAKWNSKRQDKKELGHTIES